VKTVIMLMLFF